ncbi:MAG: hypothetical protein ACR2IE_02815 [Candidatus Sumerlaeaceae bacterium]
MNLRAGSTSTLTPRMIRSAAALLTGAVASLSLAGPGTLVRAYNDPNNQVGDSFGYAVAGSGSQLLVGAPGAGTGGAVYVFSQTSSTPQSTLLVPSGMTAQAFGSAIATTSSAVIVGDPDALGPAAETSFNGAVVVYQSLTDVSPLTVANPLGQTASDFGAAVSISSSGFAVGAPSLTTGSIAQTGRAYIYATGSASPAFTLENPAPGSATGFGTAVAYSEDGLVAVGAPGSATAASGGSVSIYSASTGAMVGTIPNPGGAGDQFGFALANLGSSLIIGAPSAVTAGGAGKVYVFDRATRTLQRTLIDPTPTAGEQFGFSVDAIDHYIYVGAPHDSGAVSGMGNVYVFDANDSSNALTVPNPQPNSTDSFGFAIAAVGLNVLVGDPTSTPSGGATNAGQAFLMGGPDSAVAPPAAPSNLFAVTISSTQIRINFTDNSSNEQGFIVERRLQSGGSFSVITTLGENVVEYLDGGLAPSTGYCYRVKAFNGDGESAYTEEACTSTFAGIVPEFVGKLPNPGLPGDLFGFSLASMGKTTLAPSCVAIGAPGNDNGGTSAGIVYVFDRSSQLPLVTLPNPNPAGGDEFGFAVAAAGKYVFVGAPYDDTDGNNAGIAYMFDGETGILLRTYHSPSPHAGDYFGKSIAARGKKQLVVGAPGRSVEASGSGAAFVLDALSGIAVSTILNPTPNSGDQFGAAVAGLKGTIGVVAPASDGSSANSGELFAFNSKGVAKAVFGNASAVGSAIGKGIGGAAQQGSGGAGFAFLFGGKKIKVTYPNPSPDPGDAFGFSVAGGKKILAVGAPLDDSTGPDAGEAYLFTQKLPFVLRAFINPAPSQGDQFGFALALSAPLCYVSAPYDDTDGNDAGTVYIYNAPLK